jgi:solute carrier family 25 protein 42
MFLFYSSIYFALLRYKTLIHIFSRTYRTEGLRGLYRGFSISILGTIPYAGVGYFTYETLKRFHKKRKSDNPNPVYRLVYGALAGVAGQTTTYPLDILRRRIQTANFINPNESHLNAIQLFEKILHQEGFIKGLYKGLSMNWIKGQSVKITIKQGKYLTLHLYFFYS